MLATTARRCPAGAKTAARRAAGAARSKSAVAAAAASENVKNFKIYRWDPNEKVGTLCVQRTVPLHFTAWLFCQGSGVL